MPISNELQCLFIHIPKTAGTSIEKAMGMFGPWQKENLSSLFGMIQSPELLEKEWLSPFLQHVTYPQAMDVLHGPQRYFFSFSFVRNPWDRVVSSFSNPDPNLCQFAKEKGTDLKTLDFRDFVLKIARIKHVHFASQSDFILGDNNQLLVDFVGRYENLVRDFQAICSRLNISFNLPHHNRSARRKGQDYRTYYSSETRQMVAQMYARDIEVFGYKF